MSTPAMPLEVIDLTDAHRQLLEKLSELVPGLAPDSPQSLQRIFGLGLIALTIQVTNKARQQDQQSLIEELGVLAKAVVESEDW